MRYIIGGNMQIAHDYCKKMLGLSPEDHSRVRCYSVTTLAKGPGLRGLQFVPGDRVYEVGMLTATGNELLEIQHQLAMCTAGLAVKFDTVPSQSGKHDVDVLTMLTQMEADVDEEMREIEELRRMLTEQQ